MFYDSQIIEQDIIQTVFITIISGNIHAAEAAVAQWEQQ